METIKLNYYMLFVFGLASIVVSVNIPGKQLRENGKMVKEKLKKYPELYSITAHTPSPPDFWEYIHMARYVMHQTDWVSFATISTQSGIEGFPFANIVSMSDGPVQNSTGIPFFYLTGLDFTAIDLAKDNRCTVTVSLEQTGYCTKEVYEPDDPRCARVMLSGSIVKVDVSTPEGIFIRDALFSRHPGMKRYPNDHQFFFAKLNIKQIALLDYFGGPHYLSVRDYLAYNGNSAYTTINLL